MREFVLAVCVVSLAVSVLERVTEGMKLGKQVHFILSLVLVTVIISPVARSRAVELPTLDVGEIDMGYGYDIDSEVERQTEENICEVLGGELESAGIDYSFLKTDVNISDSGCITINRVVLGGVRDFDIAERIIKQNLGEETEVINGNY